VVSKRRSPGRELRRRHARAAKAGAAKRSARAVGSRPRYKASSVAVQEVKEIESLRAELHRVARSSAPPRWNANPDDVQRSVVKLVLTLIEFIRRILERQAIRRMDAGTLTAEETEAIGTALMRLESTVRDLGAQFGLSPEDLNLDLGPIGKML
jgi:gas vesicle protein GvpK